MKMYRIIRDDKGSWTKKLRIMKLTVILLFGSLVAMSANTYSQKHQAKPVGKKLLSDRYLQTNRRPK